MTLRALVLAASFAATGAARAAERDGCERVIHEGAPYTVCTADLATHRAATYLRGADGRILGSFEALERVEPRRILFATNGGMYHRDRRPVGLYVEDGRAETQLVTRAGTGNFGMLPNGVLCLHDGFAAVVESRRFADGLTPCRHATQSGPMLVLRGALHPRFIPNSPSRKRRNGAGVTDDGGTLVLAISDVPVNFHDFATLFRDRLGVADALFLDGTVSRLHAPALGRSDAGRPMGPIVAVTER